MSTKETVPKDLVTLTGIRGWWPILGAVAMIVGGWVTMGAQLRTTQLDLARLRVEFDVQMISVGQIREERNLQYTSIQVELAKLNATLLYVQKEIEKFEGVIK